jgi:hypothetical protein
MPGVLSQPAPNPRLQRIRATRSPLSRQPLDDGNHVRDAGIHERHPAASAASGRVDSTARLRLRFLLARCRH